MFQGSKATWSDVRGSATFGFYTVWQPYIDHLVSAIHLFDCDLGSDDYKPTQALVCDRANDLVYVAPIDSVMRFLDNQHPPRQALTPEQWSEIKELLAHLLPLEMNQIQDLGMFELFAPPKPEYRELAVQLVQGWISILMRR